MGYLNENGLARYDGLIKNWVTYKSGTVEGIEPLLNWQKTSTAGAVTFYPLPAAPIDPVVNFSFTETSPIEGDKSPTNPSTITGVSSITVTRCETVGVDSTDYTVNLGDTYYGGSIDLATGLMTVTHAMVELDGTEEWTAVGQVGTSGIYRYTTPVSVRCSDPTVTQACSHYNYVYSIYNETQHFYVTQYTLNIFSTIATATELQTWIATQKTANTPVTVCYVVSPSTVQLTPTQIYSLSQIDPYTPRLNTVYSDQTSVQVGYPKSPQATSTELTNAIVSLGSNL